MSALGSVAGAKQARESLVSWLLVLLLVRYQLAEGMRYLHGRGIVHRDLKPENVLLSVGRVPHVRICDFGISSNQKQSVNVIARSNGSTTLDENNEHLPPVFEPSTVNEKTLAQLPPEPAAGTLEYMAPEIFACYATAADCRGRFSPSIDVYAFGVILWELLQGEPSEYRASTATATSARHSTGVWSSHDFAASRSLPSRVYEAAPASIQQAAPKARTVVGMSPSRRHQHASEHVETQTIPRRGADGGDDGDVVVLLAPANSGSGEESSARSLIDVVSNLELLRQVRYLRTPNRNSCSRPAPLSLIQVAATWSLPDLEALPQTCAAPLKRLLRDCLAMDSTRRPDFKRAVEVLSDVVGINSEASRSRRTTAASAVVEMQDAPYRGDGLNEDRLLDLDEPLVHDSSGTPRRQLVVKQGLEDGAINTAFSKAIESTALSPWGKMWHRCGLHFGSNAAEQLFVLRRLHSDECVKVLS